MPEKSEKQKLLDALVENAVCNVMFTFNNSQVSKVLESFHFEYQVASCFRYGVPLEPGSVAKSRNIICKVLPNLDECRFRSLMRVNWSTFNEIVDLIRTNEIFNGPNSWKQIPVEIQTAVLLYRLGCYGEGASVKKVSKFFGIGDGGTIINITKRVLRAICELSKKYVFWPDSTEKSEMIRRTYEELPFCIGYVDGSEIRLAQKPTEDPESYFSRKHQYSMKVQIVCDDQMMIRHADIGLPGSLHDSRIYKETPLYKNELKYFSGEEWIVGDSAYKLTTTVITPYRKTSTEGSLEERKNFNRYLSKYRVRVEHCFGILKERFPSLKELKLQIGSNDKNKLACQWILSCFVLHNIIRKEGNEEDFETSIDDNNNGDAIADDNNVEDAIADDNNIAREAENKRRAILELILNIPS